MLVNQRKEIDMDKKEEVVLTGFTFLVNSNDKTSEGFLNALGSVTVRMNNYIPDDLPVYAYYANQKCTCMVMKTLVM
jgi:hypothetical protein